MAFKSKFFIFYVVSLLASLSSLYAQELKFEEPVKLGPEINTEAEEINPLLSPDGKTLYFSRMFSPANKGGKIAGPDIWMSTKKEDGTWSIATNQSQWNNKGSNAVIGINSENNTVYLLNAYSQKKGIAFSKNINGQWIQPEVIPIPGLEQSEFVGYYMHPDFDVLLISMKRKDSFGEEDLYVSLKDGKGNWGAPQNLGSSINTSGVEMSPFLTKDKKYLYFSSNGHQGYGDIDVYVAERLYENWSVWGSPKNLGSSINGEKFDATYSTLHDSINFFVSNRNSNFSDIYLAKRKKTYTNLKDSINRIVQETQLMLNEIGNANMPKLSVENVLFDNASSVQLSANIQHNIDGYLLKYQARSILQIDVIQGTSTSAVDIQRVKNLISYIIANGVQPELIRQRTSATITDSRIIQLEFQTKN